jgi:hypothetical protein
VKRRTKLRLDLTGRRFGKLTPIKWTKFNGQHRYWLCKCDCGKEKEIAATHLIGNKTYSCGCSQVKIGKENNNWKGCGAISGAYFSQIKRKAKERGIAFGVSIEYIWELFLKQEGECALTGIELQFPNKNKQRYTASLDRINSDKGYEKGNIQWILGDINWMKNNFSQDYFIEICHLVSKKFQKA